MPRVPDRCKNFLVPGMNLTLVEIWDSLFESLKDKTIQKKIVLVVVSIALLLDNMLYMVIVPIIPDYLRRIGAWETHLEGGHVIKANELNIHYISNSTGNFSAAHIPTKLVNQVIVYEGEGTAIGLLFASKALIQLMVNPISGTIIDKIGYDVPMCIGLLIMFFSTAIFSMGKSYSVLFFARSLQGVGSAFADTAGLAMIADTYTEEKERTKALGIALAFISFGCLVAPPFGGTLYEFCGKEVPFIILAFVCLFDAIMLMIVMRPIRAERKDKGWEQPKGTPIFRLFMDPSILVVAGSLTMANVSLAFLEPTISVWMMDNMDVKEWQLGMIWLPSFFPHVAGVVFTVKMASKYPNYQWILATIGLAMEGISCFFLPFATNYWVVMIPICFICFGIALVDTALLPTLGYLVDTRYVSVYGSIYAIADISYSLAYAFGPLIAGSVVSSIGFVALNIGIAISTLIYCPVLFYLKNVYDGKLEHDLAVQQGLEAKAAQEKQLVIQDENHLEYSKLSDFSQEGYGTYEGIEMAKRSSSGQQGYDNSSTRDQPASFQQGGNYNYQ